jgi:hypothetical protein
LEGLVPATPNVVLLGASVQRRVSVCDRRLRKRGGRKVSELAPPKGLFVDDLWILTVALMLIRSWSPCQMAVLVQSSDRRRTLAA